MKSTDRGSTWTRSSGDLPERHICLADCAGSRASRNCCSSAPNSACSSPSTAASTGSSWPAMFRRSRSATWRSSGAKTIWSQHPSAAGFYVLDDYSPLRRISEERLAEEFLLFPVKTALQYRPARAVGRRKRQSGRRLLHRAESTLRCRVHVLSARRTEDQKQIRQEQESKHEGSGRRQPVSGLRRTEARGARRGSGNCVDDRGCRRTMSSTESPVPRRPDFTASPGICDTHRFPEIGERSAGYPGNLPGPRSEASKGCHDTSRRNAGFSGRCD